MRYKLNLDADGVLVDFDGHCAKLTGKSPRESVYECPQLGTLTGDAALWRHVADHPTFWLDTPFFPWADDLVALGQDVGVRIITGCPRDGFELASEQKLKKMTDRWPGIEVVRCFSRDKATYLQEPGDILVDDFIRNIRRWENAGGVGVYFKDYERARERIVELLD